MAKVWMMSYVMLLPALASANQYGGGHGGGKSAFSALMLAAVAVLGYYVLKQNKNEKGALLWAGRGVGWALAVVGLVGFLCASLTGHNKYRVGRNHTGDRHQHSSMSGQHFPGHVDEGKVPVGKDGNRRDRKKRRKR